MPTVAPGDTTAVNLTLTNQAGTGDTATYNKMYIFEADDTTLVNPTLTVTDSQSGSVSFNCFDFDAISWRCEPTSGDTVLHDGETYKISITGVQLNANVPDGTTVKAGSWNVHFDGGQGVFPPPPPFEFFVKAGTPAPQEADIAVNLEAQSGLLTSSIPYTLAIDNNGPGTASSATITSQLPATTSAVSGLPGDCAYDAGTDQVACSVGSLASGAGTTRTFTARLGLLTIGLPLTTTATRTASAPADPNPANDSDSASCLALTPILVLC